MKQEQIDEIYEYIKYNTGSYDDDARSCAEILYNYLGYRKPEWISVEDRLPEKSGTYLVHYHDDIIGEYVITREYWEKQRKFAPMEYFEEHTGRKVMHWMPLPSPPTDKEN